MPKMSKQTAIVFILTVFLGALGALIWFYFNANNTQPKIVITPVSTDVYDPFGTKLIDNVATSTNVVVENTITTPADLNRFRQISTDPISGFSIVENTKTQKTDIHYILRANGNIYETYSDSPEQKRLSITTIPKVYESVWMPDGQKLIIRYLKDVTENVQTFSVKINPATTTLNEFEGGVDGNHLSENIKNIAVSPKGDRIFYLTSSLSGSSAYISKTDGLNKKIIFESPLTEWLVSWPKEEIIAMTTKPSANIPGYMYSLNSQTGSFYRIIGDIKGLTTKMNSAGTEVLYSDSSRITPKIYLYNIKKGESKVLPFNTLPEKCVWGNTDSKMIYCAIPKTFPTGEQFPDSWYQGLISFDDSLWAINTDTLATSLIFDIEKESGIRMDISEIQIDKKDNYLFFTNKTDLTFWSLKLK
jgi:hypothetical protein